MCLVACWMWRVEVFLKRELNNPFWKINRIWYRAHLPWHPEVLGNHKIHNKQKIRILFPSAGRNPTNKNRTPKVNFPLPLYFPLERLFDWTSLKTPTNCSQRKCSDCTTLVIPWRATSGCCPNATPSRYRRSRTRLNRCSLGTVWSSMCPVAIWGARRMRM